MANDPMFHSGDFAIESTEKLWTIKAIGRMVGQTPIVFTIKTDDASGVHSAYNRMILQRCMDSLSEQFTLGFSWTIFDCDYKLIEKSGYNEFIR